MKIKNHGITLGSSALLIGGFVIKFLWFVLAFILVWGLAKFITKDLPVVKKLGKIFKLDQIDKFFSGKLSYLYDFLPDKLYRIFLLRVPIISGIILFAFPLIAQFIAPQFLQNLFVMGSGVQLIIVMVAATATAITIISLLKTILIVIDNKSNEDNHLRIIRSILTVVLFLPSWILLLSLNNEETNLENIEWLYRFLGIVIGLILFVLAQLYEYKIVLGSRKKENLRKRRFVVFASEIVLGFFFYALIICLNWPLSSLLKEWQDWQAPTLLYVLLIIWVLTLFVGLVALIFDQSVDKRLDADTEKKTNLFKHTFYWPVILFLIVFSGLGYGVFNVDHYFKLEDSKLSAIENYQQDFQKAIWNRLCDEKFQDGVAQNCNKNKPANLVVVAASGGGIQASGWMTQVLAGLQNDKELGEEFTKAIGLISSASGGSVGSMFYLDQFDNGVLKKAGLEPSKKNPELSQVVENATDDWLNSVGWGLAFPDMFRAIGLPILLQPFREQGGDNEPHLYLDRGYALEKNWQKTLTLNGKEIPTLDSRRTKILAGEIPISVYNTTLVENGRRFLISPMKFVQGTMADYAKEPSEKNLTKSLDFKTLYNNCGEKGDQACDLALTTAARLSASFPYVTPMARNDRENNINVKDDQGQDIPFLQNYHIADGGYFDNAGAFTAMEWLNDFLKYNKDNNGHYINIKKVLLLQINAFPEEKLQLYQEGKKAFQVVTLGPLDTLAGIRDSTQIARNQTFATLLNDRWEDIKIKDFTISFPQKDLNGKNYNPPLSWRLTQQQKNNLKDAWQTHDVKNEVKNIIDFWKEEAL